MTSSLHFVDQQLPASGTLSAAVNQTIHGHVFICHVWPGRMATFQPARRPK
jgi:hypothetical protein